MTPAMLGLISLQVISTLLNWWTAYTNKRRTYAVTKVLVMLVWITLFFLFDGAQGSGVWFLLALIFSLVGDILLLFSMRIFLMGLYAFLVSHIFFIIGFNQIPPSIPQSLIGFGMVLLLVAVIAVPIWKGVSRKPELKKFSLPIIIYAFVLSSMAVSAGLSLFKPQWNSGAAWLAAFGGVLFLASDAMLAYNRFIKRFRLAPLLVIVTYHLAQFCLILSYLWMAGKL